MQITHENDFIIQLENEQVCYVNLNNHIFWIKFNTIKLIFLKDF